MMYHVMNECQLIFPKLFPNNLLHMPYLCKLCLCRLLLLFINLLALICFVLLCFYSVKIFLFSAVIFQKNEFCRLRNCRRRMLLSLRFGITLLILGRRIFVIFLVITLLVDLCFHPCLMSWE